MTELLLLTAAFLAGAMNAVAGGGSFLTLPALIYAGVPPVAANATGTVALLPGYASGLYGYRQDLTPVGEVGLPLLALVSLAGGLAGAGLLLVTPDAVFRGIVPWLLLAATGLFAFGGALAARLRAVGLHGRGALLGTLLVVSVYGGYFNGGLGILLLAQLSLFGMTNLNAMNGLKNLFSTVLTAIAVVAYALGGAVDWPKAALMVLAAVAGGYVGARLGRRIPQRVLRGGIIAVGLTMSALFFAK
ncbi:sulfite exporter TauE/SafE family protein [Azospirillum cavernae]|uniref:Probable membrane transporter protein n=1 Tax=Azospirillum cavernae TaxID=2320860 RepID=A0A418VN56_9PROT|nr:sulfite exporter TauE/SafE family protein [Azospirillum cavernae]RJF77616.1 sulfite exporter TauE/SafE family protein [Azospirillum cavernae]